MFRDMRRKRQQLGTEESLTILQNATSGVLALLGDEDYPYAVPISHVYHEGKLYFHSALSGHKIDAIEGHDKASFCVVEKDKVLAEEYTTYFKSVAAFGRIRILNDQQQKLRALEILAERFSPNQVEGRVSEIEKGFSKLHMIEFDIEHITGKESIELVKRRK